MPAFAGLVDKAYNSAIAFRPGFGGQQIFVGTGEHKLRLYDTRQRRPAQAIAFHDAAVTALAAECGGEDVTPPVSALPHAASHLSSQPSLKGKTLRLHPDVLAGRRCWAADSQGRIEVFDVAAGKLHGAMQPCGGSIRALALQPHGQLLASVGLDRYLRLHSTESRKTVSKVYLKQQLTGRPSLDMHMADAAMDDVPNGASVAGIFSGGGGSFRRRRLAGVRRCWQRPASATCLLPREPQAPGRATSCQRRHKAEG